MEVPIIPKATTYQGERLLPRKKALLLSAFFPVIKEIIISKEKYPSMISKYESLPIRQK